MRLGMGIGRYIYDSKYGVRDGAAEAEAEAEAEPEEWVGSAGMPQVVKEMSAGRRCSQMALDLY